MTADVPAIELRAVRRAYAAEEEGAPLTPALDGIDVSIRRGELVAVCGPSGSGKSTFLHLAGVLDTPTEGEVLVEGRPISGLSASERAKVRNASIGFVFQAFNLMRGLTATENIALPAVLARRKPADIDARVRDLLSLVGLEHKGDRRPSQLSGGEQQRVALARALVLDPPIVLADEPTATSTRRRAGTSSTCSSPRTARDGRSSSSPTTSASPRRRSASSTCGTAGWSRRRRRSAARLRSPPSSTRRSAEPTQPIETTSTVRLAPVGESKSTLSPGLLPRSALPRGEPGLMISCSLPRSSTEP